VVSSSSIVVHVLEKVLAKEDASVAFSGASLPADQSRAAAAAAVKNAARARRPHPRPSSTQTMPPKKVVEEETLGPWALGRFSSNLKVRVVVSEPPLDRSSRDRRKKQTPFDRRSRRSRR
jgi:hypothetical protein